MNRTTVMNLHVSPRVYSVDYCPIARDDTLRVWSRGELQALANIESNRLSNCFRERDFSEHSCPLCRLVEGTNKPMNL